MIRLRQTGIFLLFFAPLSAFCTSNLYSVKDIVDSTYGIIFYEKYNPQVGGEDIRMDDYAKPCISTVIDYYDDGSILHKGSYVNGTLITYKNFYPDGKLERRFKGLAGGRYQLETYYPSGTLRSKIIYFRKDAISWNEYYSNGQIEFSEKYNSRFLLLYRRSFGEDGKTQTTFELISKRNNTYSHKEYYENGALKEEGGMVFSDDVVDFKREGTWKIYDEAGKLVRLEEYVHGEFNIGTQANASPPKKTITPVAANNTSSATNKVNNPSTPKISTTPTAEEVDSFFEEEDTDNATDETTNTKKKNKKSKTTSP